MNFRSEVLAFPKARVSCFQRPWFQVATEKEGEFWA